MNKQKGRTRKYGNSCYKHESDAIGRVVYLAHPVSGNVEENLEKARAWLKHYSELNPEIAFVTQWIVECEIWDDADPVSREQGLKRCIALVERCDELWCVGESITAGMKRELNQACAFGVPVLDLTGSNADITIELLNESHVVLTGPSGLKSEVAEFASNIERIPQEIRDMSDVPRAFQESQEAHNTPEADQPKLEAQLKVMTEERDELRQSLKELEESRCADCKIPIERGHAVTFMRAPGAPCRTLCQECAALIMRYSHLPRVVPL